VDNFWPVSGCSGIVEPMFDSSAEALVGEITDSVGRESVLMAQRCAAIAALLALRTVAAEAADPDPGWSMITGFARTTAEVSAAMNMTARGAQHLVAQAEALDTRLPQVAALLAAALGGDADQTRLLPGQLPLRFHCPCSWERAASTLALLGELDLLTLIREEGEADVTCEFCRARYAFTDAALENIRQGLRGDPGPPS